MTVKPSSGTPIPRPPRYGERSSRQTRLPSTASRLAAVSPRPRLRRPRRRTSSPRLPHRPNDWSRASQRRRRPVKQGRCGRPDALTRFGVMLISPRTKRSVGSGAGEVVAGRRRRVTAIGNPPDILSAEFAADPYPAYRAMRDEHPLVWHEAMRSYVISRYDDVERAFKDPVFTSRNYDWQLEPVHGRTILQMDGREHSTHRNLVAPAFRGRELAEKFVPVIERNSRELIDAFRGRREGRPRRRSTPPGSRSTSSSTCSACRRPTTSTSTAGTRRSWGSCRTSPATRPSTADGSADQGRVRGLHDPDHPRAPREPGRRPALDALRRRDRRRADDRPGDQGVLQPAAHRGRRDHGQGDRQPDVATWSRTPTSSRPSAPTTR